MAILKNADVALHYQCIGDANKPTLIFSNSLGTDMGMWQSQVVALQDAYHIVCYDTRGHGQSSAPTGPYTLAQLGQDVVALLDHLAIPKAHFCGISMGGLTGQWLAIHHPERFLSITISNTAAKIGQEAAWRERAALVREQGLQPIAATAASRWFTADFIQTHADVVAQMGLALAAGSAEGYASCCEALAVADLRGQLADIAVPMLIVAGSEDPVTTVADGQAMQAVIAGSQLYEIHASHIANVEQADDFNRVLLQFTQQVAV